MRTSSTIRKDVFSAYLAAGMRIVSWVAVSALVYRRHGAEEFATLALVRATIGLLNYTTLGLAPAMIHFLPARLRPRRQPLAGMVEGADLPAPDDASAQTDATDESPETLYCNGIALAWLAAIVAGVLLVGYEIWFTHRHTPSAASASSIGVFLTTMGVGMIFRLAGEPSSALLQVRGRLAVDNLFLALSELLWMFFSIAGGATLDAVGVSFLIACVLLWTGRTVVGFALSGIALPTQRPLRAGILRALLTFGVVITLAQAAEFLYAPTDYILIDRLLRPIDVAAYAPAIQIDGGLLLLATAMASVLLPRAAIAHAQNDRAALRRYYLTGTAATLAVLAVASVVVWWIAPRLFTLWLGNPMPATCALLPLMLINTVLGGSGIVGRAVLLGAGRVRSFAAAVVIAGIVNVIFSYLFVRFFGAGLRGIVLGTSIAVIGRCAIWMPWYVWRTFREEVSAASSRP